MESFITNYYYIIMISKKYLHFKVYQKYDYKYNKVKLPWIKLLTFQSVAKISSKVP